MPLSTSMTTQVTIPVLTLSANTQLNTTSLPASFTVYARDANGSVHYVNAPLAVTLASSATGAADDVALSDASGACGPGGFPHAAKAMAITPYPAATVNATNQFRTCPIEGVYPMR